MSVQIQKIIANKLSIKAGNDGFYTAPDSTKLSVKQVVDIVSEIQIDNKLAKEPSNLHIVKVTTLHRTETKPARVKLQSERFKDNKAVILSYSDFNESHNEEIAARWMNDNGYPVVAFAEGKNCMYVLTNKFKPLVK